MKKINKIVGSIIMTLTVGLSLVSCKDYDDKMENSKTTTITQNNAQNQNNTQTTQNNAQNQNNTQMANPFIDCNSLLEASNITGFEIDVPDYLSHTLNLANIRVMNREMIEVIYTGDSEKLCIRKAIGNKDISGNYNSFSDIHEIQLDDSMVTFKGNNGKVNVATWIDDEYSFSVDSTKGLTKQEMISLVSEIE